MEFDRIGVFTYSPEENNPAEPLTYSERNLTARDGLFSSSRQAPPLMSSIRDEKKICHYLDIPIQHASDRILKRMGRRTSKQELACRAEPK